MMRHEWFVLSFMLLAGCAETNLPLEEVTDVHAWLAEWHYELPEDFYTQTAFLHCGDARIYGDGTGKLLWDGESPTLIMVNRLAPGSDHPDAGNEEGYAGPLNLVSPIDGHQYGVSQIQWSTGASYVDTRMVQHGEGHMVEMTESVTLTKLGAVSMLIDRNQYGCD